MSKDQLYQNAVDREAEKLLTVSKEFLLNISDCGSFRSTIEDKEIHIAFWHWKFDNGSHHIVFIAQRNVFLFLYRKYLAGVKLENDEIQALSPSELGCYD